MSIWYHLHGGLTHFPIALAISSFVFDFLGAASAKSSLRAAGLWTIILAALASIPAVATGFFTAAYDYPGGAGVVIHRNVSLVAGVLLVVLAAWRAIKRDDLSRRAWVAYLVGVLMAAGSVGLTGWLGNKALSGG